MVKVECMAIVIINRNYQDPKNLLAAAGSYNTHKLPYSIFLKWPIYFMKITMHSFESRSTFKTRNF